MTKRKDTEKIRLCQKIGDSYASVDDGEGIIFVNTRIKDESMKARRFAHFLDWDNFIDSEFPSIEETSILCSCCGYRLK